MVIPPALVFGGWLIGAATLPGGCALIILGIVAAAASGVLIAHQLAKWRYALAVRRSERNEKFPSRASYILRMTIILGTVQVIACVFAFAIVDELVRWLTELGYLPCGWS